VCWSAAVYLDRLKAFSWIIFDKTLINVLQIIEEVWKEPLGEIQSEKMAGWEGSKVFVEPMSEVKISQGSVENPFRVLYIWEACFKTLKKYCGHFLAGSA
jgi:hypothetical protein